jgi:hypothetical protein
MIVIAIAIYMALSFSRSIVFCVYRAIDFGKIGVRGMD